MDHRPHRHHLPIALLTIPTTSSSTTTNNINTFALIGSFSAGLVSLFLGMCFFAGWRHYSGDDVKHSRFDDASEDYYRPEIYTENENENDVRDHHHDQDDDRNFMDTEMDTVSAATTVRKIHYRDDKEGDDDVVVDVNESYITTDDENDYVARVIPRASDGYGNSRLSADVFHHNTSVPPSPLGGVDSENTKLEEMIQSDSDSSSRQRKEFYHQHHHHSPCSSPSCRRCESKRQQQQQQQQIEGIAYQWLQQKSYHTVESDTNSPEKKVPTYDPSPWFLSEDEDDPGH